MGEMVRLARPGGSVLAFDFDSDQTVVDAPDPALVRRIAEVLDAAVPQPWVGRQPDPTPSSPSGIRGRRIDQGQNVAQDRAAYAMGAALAPSGNARWSCRRELISSLVKTLRRCHSTVRGDRNSWAAISGLDRPALASRAIWSSCGVSWSCVTAVRVPTA